MTPGNATITIVINIVLWQIFSSVCGNILAFDVSDFVLTCFQKHLLVSKAVLSEILSL